MGRPLSESQHFHSCSAGVGNLSERRHEHVRQLSAEVLVRLPLAPVLVTRQLGACNVGPGEFTLPR